MKPARRARLEALGALHEEWVKSKLAAVPFDPGSRPGSDDYNQHYVDLDGDDDAFHAAAMAIVRGDA